MSLLYVGRYFPDKDMIRRRKKRREKIRFMNFRGQSGFFRASLFKGFDTREVKLAYLRKHAAKISRKFDYLVVCSKADSSGIGFNQREFDFIDKIRDIPKALFVSNSQAEFLPDDSCLDRFDVVFKREHFKDLDRYPIANQNKDKIRRTWLACNLVPARYDNIDTIQPTDFGLSQPAAVSDYDVCFAGKQSAPLRRAAWARIKDSGLSMLGGLQPHENDPVVNPHLAGQKMSHEEFTDAIRRARVNLALEGIGEFTHRHLELWLLSAFCLSSPSIRELALPGGATDGEHFVCYENFDDMIDKIRYYSEMKAERERIAHAGHELFAEHYDFQKHARFIKGCLDNV